MCGLQLPGIRWIPRGKILEDIASSFRPSTMSEQENSLSGDHLVAIWEVMNLKLVRLRLSNLIEAGLGESGKMLQMSKLGIEPVSTSFAALTLPKASDTHTAVLITCSNNPGPDEPLLLVLVVVEGSNCDEDDVSHLVS